MQCQYWFLCKIPHTLRSIWGHWKRKRSSNSHNFVPPLLDSTCTKLVEKHGGISIMLALPPSFTSAASSWVIGWYRKERANKDRASWFHCPFLFFVLCFFYEELRGRQRAPYTPVVVQLYLTKRPPELNYAPPCFASAKARRLIDFTMRHNNGAKTLQICPFYIFYVGYIISN
jgi:hypothetical protein